MREKTIEQKLVRAVENRGGVCWKWVSPSMTGVPDRICIFPGGKILFAELKRPGLSNGRSEKQKYVHALLQRYGCDVRTISTLEEIEDAVSAV